MSHTEFNHIVDSINALSPEQMKKLRDELDSKLAAAKQHAAAPATSEGQAATPHKPVWERILERTAAIPEEEWDKLPADLAEQHDHYLYGTPKRPAR